MTTPPTVLFICQHNAGRSQLGAHLLGVIAPDQFIASSGGLKPADEINPVVAESLHEVGADTSTARPRLVTATDLATADVVVTMKPGLQLPGPVRGRLVEWAFPNPEEWNLEGVRAMRDAVGTEVHGLVAELRSSR
ncbi:arsenate-mycothiol transferase ArsC [Microbacterium allomyrinae]|uniref:Low molecular weight phosphatase family protein n=1 Tax=Microbacterium allomyrinae TaxID=2830666 RepID=A0A9X1LSJ0_9MICO|nr:low molecular weight phosphatase family protein [Microbacterium allomyrinae]MCC2031051.1 low molecular weight phosphatase family protein [Microbacterium allomyrinae]